MLFGHNTNVEHGGEKFHVQTEDRGIPGAVIDTTVHHRGRVLHRATTEYKDLLPLDSRREEELKGRIDDQHRGIVEAIRSGELKLDTTVRPPGVLKLEVMNAKTWLAGKRATLQVSVRDEEGNAVADARVVVTVDGAAEPTQFSAQSGLYGQAQFEFDLPRLTGDEPALAIEASEGASRGQMRFQLKAKPKVPAV